MPFLSLRLAICLGLALAMMTGPVAAGCSMPKGGEAMAQQVFDLVNSARRKAGLATLRKNTALAGAARSQACDNAATQKASHTGAGGSSLSQRLKRAGYRFRVAAENVGLGFNSDPGQAVAWWLKSPEHRANILHPKLTDMAVFVAQGPKHSWTVVFGGR